MLQKLDDSVIERILRKLPPRALAAAQLVCSSWSDLIDKAQLWRHHAAPDSSSSSTSSKQTPVLGVPQPWRQMCLNMAASSKWISGRLTVSSTLTGHSGPVTCMATLHTLVITGSSDGTARVWDLAHNRQQHLLQMPGQEGVVAVALPSVSLAVTATARGGAVLWRAGRAIRRFEPVPGGRVAAVALTDTQLLLGTSGGVVQHFDIFSGQQQLITRHASGVTCLTTHRQQLVSAAQQQQQQSPAAAEEWVTLVGCVDGQVSCLTSATGRALWTLPTRHPSKVVSMQLVDWQPGLHNPSMPQPHQQQQQQKGKRVRASQQPQQQQQQQRRQELLLYVLNARSQLICWKLPGAVLDPGAVPPPPAAAAAGSLRAKTGSAQSSTPAAAAVGRSGVHAAGSMGGAAAGAQLKLPTWPMTVCSVAAPAPQPQPAQHNSDEQQQQGRRQLLRAAHNSSTCLLSPEFGRDCLIVGSSLGYLTVVKLTHPTAAAAGAIVAGAGEGQAATTTAATGAVDAAGGSRGATAAATDGEPSGSLSRPGASPALTPTTAAAAAAPAIVAIAVPAGVESSSAAAQGTPVTGPQALRPTLQQQQQQQEQHATPAQPEVLSSGAGSSTSQQQSVVVRHCPLHKLGRMLAGRQAASIAAHGRTTARPAPAAASGAAAGGGGGALGAAKNARPQPQSSSSSLRGAGSLVAGSAGGVQETEAVAAQAAEHMWDGSKVCCMQWGAGGQLLVGLGSGHVCCLKMKQSAGCKWA